MEFTSVTSPPPNTFRPIQESEGHHSVVDLHNLVEHHGMVDPHGVVDHHGVVDQQVAPDPHGAPQPLSSRTPKLGNWRCSIVHIYISLFSDRALFVRITFHFEHLPYSQAGQ